MSWLPTLAWAVPGPEVLGQQLWQWLGSSGASSELLCRCCPLVLLPMWLGLVLPPLALAAASHAAASHPKDPTRGCTNVLVSSSKSCSKAASRHQTALIELQQEPEIWAAVQPAILFLKRGITAPQIALGLAEGRAKTLACLKEHAQVQDLPHLL